MRHQTVTNAGRCWALIAAMCLIEFIPQATVVRSSELSGYDATVLADKPAGFWPLSEASGPTAVDASDNNIAGAYMGGVSFGGGGDPVGGPDIAPTFDGSSAYVALPDRPELQPPSVSIEAWLKTLASGVGEQVLVRKRLYGYSLSLDTGTGQPMFWVYTGEWSSAAQTTVIGASPVNDGRWHYLAGTYDGGTVRLFVDGVLADAEPAARSNAVTYHEGGIAIGRDGDYSGSYFQGSLQAVAIYGRAISTDRVQAHFTTGSGKAAGPPLVAGMVYWQADFETGNLSQWAGIHDGTTNPANGNTRAHIVTTPVRAGRYAVSLTNGPQAAGTERCEIGNTTADNHGFDGQEAYYGFSVYFPSSNRSNWPPLVWDWNGFFQFISDADEPIGMGIDTGDFGVDEPHMFLNVNVSPNGVSGSRLGSRWTDPDPLPYDIWMDIVFHVRWSTGQTGLIQVWKNGVSIVSRENVRTLSSGPVFMELQNYGPARNSPGSILFDEVRIGDSYAAVDPAARTPASTLPRL